MVSIRGIPSGSCRLKSANGERLPSTTNEMRCENYTEERQLQCQVAQMRAVAEYDKKKSETLEALNSVV